MNNRGFTLIELLVAIAIIAILSAIILFSIGQYINRSKDASIAGNLSVLIPAGEVWYDHNNNNGYTGFCNSDVKINSFAQFSSDNEKCNVALNGNAWSACAQLFANKDKAFCVDSRGVKKEISANECSDSLTICQ